MKIYPFDSGEFYEAVQFHDHSSRQDFLEMHFKGMIFYFTKKRGVRNLLDAYGCRNRLEGYILLRAHGCRGYGEWIFSDGRRKHKIQDFIDRHDGRCLSLLLDVCNPWHLEVHAKKSVIIHPRGKINLLGILTGESMRVFVPGYGYAEENPSKVRGLLMD